MEQRIIKTYRRETEKIGGVLCLQSKENPPSASITWKFFEQFRVAKALMLRLTIVTKNVQRGRDTHVLHQPQCTSQKLLQDSMRGRSWQRVVIVGMLWCELL